MRRIGFLLPTVLGIAAAALGPLASSCSAQETSPAPEVYRGMCDASAAVALDGKTFLAADDERNVLCVYDANRAGLPRQEIPWDVHLGIDPREDEHPEADIEGAARLGGRIYWITSHGRNKKGKWRANRHRFFAITVTSGENGVVARPFGKAYRNLIEDLVEDEKLQGLGLAESLRSGEKEVEELAPKEEGLNVEGLCATPDGKSLLIGFRNPRPDGKALLVPLMNPAAVVAEGQAPEFGPPILLPLGVRLGGKSFALGIRSIAYSPRHKAYLIAAGPHDTQKVFAVFRWSGRRDQRPALLAQSTAAIHRLKDFSPEALIVYPEGDAIQLLSDDGALKVKVASAAECQEGTFESGACEAKYLLDDKRKTFRSLRIVP